MRYAERSSNYARPAGGASDPEAAGGGPPNRLGRSVRYLWVRLLARIDEAFPLTCPQCGAERPIIAFITEAMPVRAILESIGEPANPPRIAQTRGPPQWDEDATANAIDAEACTAADFGRQGGLRCSQRASVGT